MSLLQNSLDEAAANDSSKGEKFSFIFWDNGKYLHLSRTVEPVGYHPFVHDFSRSTSENRPPDPPPFLLIGPKLHRFIIDWGHYPARVQLTLITIIIQFTTLTFTSLMFISLYQYFAFWKTPISFDLSFIQFSLAISDKTSLVE